MAGDEMEMTEEDAALAAAIDAAQDDRLADELGPIFWAHGHGGVVEPKAMRENRERVEALIERDKADRIRERDRKAAELEVGRGNFVNLADTVVEPTPEWQERVAHRGYTPKQPDGTVRSVKTVRRVITPVVARMHKAGKINDDHLRSCLWYRKMFDEACLDGRYSGSRYMAGADFGASSRTIHGGAGGHIPMTLHEAYARQMFRAARKSIKDRHVKYFDSVVINDVAIARAVRFARCRNSRAVALFREIADNLVEFCEANEVDLLGIERDGAIG